MNADPQITPENLSLLAAAVDPTLAFSEPEKAIRSAANLLRAAHDFLNPDEVEKARLMAAAEEADSLFPREELISIEEAWKAQLKMPDAKGRVRYKSLKRFSQAIDKRLLFTITRASKRPMQELIESKKPITDEDFVREKWTSLRAAKELLRLAKDDELRLDRERKKGPKTKPAKRNLKKSSPENKPSKPERVFTSTQRPKHKNRN